ncbi:hypothetical protein [Streptosporangium roseum]|uniref:hypothetical protein n=1 Tax=Streptosporangium roseum TaxID=2001 RepID=UPI0012DE96E6|nr:hypothetical protein [Streptosporangium roseum]
MIESPPRLRCHVFPHVDGVRVVPPNLPIHVPRAAYTLTVAEWLDLEQHPDVTPD